jgi:hypothetical protein
MLEEMFLGRYKMLSDTLDKMGKGNPLAAVYE